MTYAFKYANVFYHETCRPTSQQSPSPMTFALRQNSRLRSILGPELCDFLHHAIGAFGRILPHTEIDRWEERSDVQNEGAHWTSNQRKNISLSINVAEETAGTVRSLCASLERKHLPTGVGNITRTLDTREHQICGAVINRLSTVLKHRNASVESLSPYALKDFFDEQIVADCMRTHHQFALDPAAIFAALHELSEQTYENKPLSFGCLLEANSRTAHDSVPSAFPEQLLSLKKFRALSDGYKTAYRVASDGDVLGFVDLEDLVSKELPLSGRKFYPDWLAPMASASRKGRCGICLTRNGDILVIEDGNLRFSYRFGRWQYWNHSHISDLLRNLTRVQRVPSSLIGEVATTVYRASLDASFRRNGALFVILRNRNNLRQIVRRGDAIDDPRRTAIEQQFDNVLRTKQVQTLPRSVVVELSSLDGALVTNNHGQLLAYGAVLSPRRYGGISGTEGSRTKAAIGASHYGLAVKVSSDGGITVYHKGKEFLEI